MQMAGQGLVEGCALHAGCVEGGGVDMQGKRIDMHFHFHGISVN